MIATSLQTTVCLHCGSEFSFDGSKRANDKFCCAGCETVYALMQQKGLSEFYVIRDANPPVCPLPTTYIAADFRYFDDPEFLETTSENGTRVRFFLEGMNCSACIWLLEKLPDICTDVRSARVNIGASTIEVTRKPQGSFAAIATTLNQLGYRPRPLRDNENTERLQWQEQRRDLIRIGIAAALTGNIMILTVSIYGGADGVLARQFQMLTAALAFPVLTYCAWPFYRSSFLSLRRLRLNLDVPIVAAIVAGCFTSGVAIWKNTDSIYFDSLSMLIFLLLSSRFFLKTIQSKNLQATNVEDDLLTGTVKKVTLDGTPDVSVANLNADDRILLAPGQLIPVDGRVESGSGSVSTAILTGESNPLHISRGSVVEAGFRFLSGECILKVQNPTRQTRLAAILRETEHLAESKSRFVHLADKAAQTFIGGVLVSSGIILGYFAHVGNLAEGFSRALAFVIVTCPCVFGIAIPLSMAIAIRQAARKGIIVKSGDAIEKLWKASHFYFDKTATLTTGTMQVVRSTYQDFGDLKIMHGLEKDQLHPVGRAFCSYARSIFVESAPVENIELLHAGGVTGLYEGARYTLLPATSIADSSDSDQLISKFVMLKNEHRIAEFQLSDEPRSEASDVLQKLRSQGKKIYLVSGDRRTNVEECARQLQFLPSETFSEMTPESKVQTITECPGSSVMIGDGANDAAAFAAADVGIAVCGSLDVSLRAADIYLTRPSLEAVLDLVKISRKAKTSIHRNLVFSASFNVVAGSLAAIGVMSPLWAAVIMPLSSVTVLISAAWNKGQ